ncbi:unnamed protein product [Diamesa serratosioi]
MASTLANTISELCLNFFFNKLPNAKKTLKDNEWTILSAIVIERENKYEVVSLGTGTKCIGSMLLSDKGDILNDSHSEIICRRAFLRYLMSQMMATKSDTSIFVYNDTQMKFNLRENIKFHFFTTSSPCGDASIYTINNMDDEGPENKRVKVNDNGGSLGGFTGAKLMFSEDVEDPMAQTEGKIRIKPGKGDRTLSLSCSDKMARWNLMGIQGCMLYSLLDAPIYLHSFIIADGTPYNYVSMERALYKRFENVEKLLVKPAFKLNKPQILIANNRKIFSFAKSEKTQRINPGSSSLAYCKVEETERNVEVGVSGKRQGVTKKAALTRKAHLKISKVELFTKYIEIVNEFPKLKSHLYSNFINIDDLCYKHIKTLPENDYFQQWIYLKQNYFTSWTTKNENLLNFKYF